jgi:lysine 2,3-aminomutase
MNKVSLPEDKLDPFTRDLFHDLFSATKEGPASAVVALRESLKSDYETALKSPLTEPILVFFRRLMEIHKKEGFAADTLGFNKGHLVELALKHRDTDEHGVTLGGRLGKAIPIVESANERVAVYEAQKAVEAPSGIELWSRIRENAHRIKHTLGMKDETWHSYAGQLRHVIDSVETLSQVLDLPKDAVKDIGRVSKDYRMRMTPYYASLIIPGKVNDPVLIQAVPTGEMVDNAGVEIPPVAADHSPARLIDQFYPRVLTIKATNMCAMYCTHCLRIAHIGKKDRVYCEDAYREALHYIKANRLIRDVLVTGGDAFVLPNKMLAWLLNELDSIDHVKVKRLGTRIPVTCPQRIDDRLLDILAASNDMKPIRVVTQVNTPQEITPMSRDTFRRISKSVSAILNQAVLLKGINDSQVKMWKLCETIQEAYIRPYYIFNCSFRNPQFAHLRVPIEVGRTIVESMYGNISGDAIPRYIATAGGKVPLHRDNVVRRTDGEVVLKKPWNNEEVLYPDADLAEYKNTLFSFAQYGPHERQHP